MKSKLRCSNVDATSSCRINVSETLLRHHMPAEYRINRPFLKAVERLPGFTDWFLSFPFTKMLDIL